MTGRAGNVGRWEKREAEIRSVPLCIRHLKLAFGYVPFILAIFWVVTPYKLMDL